MCGDGVCAGLGEDPEQFGGEGELPGRPLAFPPGDVIDVAEAFGVDGLEDDLPGSGQQAGGEFEALGACGGQAFEGAASEVGACSAVADEDEPAAASRGGGEGGQIGRILMQTQ